MSGVAEKVGIINMPYKNIQDRRDCSKRWRSRNKAKHLKMKLICDKARRANPIRQKCSVSGCEVIGERHHPDYSKPKEIIWLCKHHHENIHLKGFICSVPGCGRKHIANGLCHPCYKKLRRINGVGHDNA